ncbi:FkbM family methyltransferase [Natronococcus amylolyticus DSM 10524]|uniref:FkbM family methyltransferase n=1 Tax=Natronococcus amylolyticus DSM 10524 TaxID=1227497 RepID=L9XBX2_9EURY|nr:FkbM family methyltransferase [Natronococcus amylolyticus]ELY59234.1 FkbM family methyltransferase [Natronococcus amylolyticus DSM 10524]
MSTVLKRLGRSDPGTRAFRTLRGLGYGAYYRLAALNYDRELFPRRNRTPAGRFRCYEPLNRHGDDRMLAELEACCGPSAAVYDVGANVGIYALALATDEPDRRVVAFEPAPRTADRLCANVRLNGLEDRIDVRPCGIGDESGDRPFYVSTYPELSAFDRASAARWEASVADVRPVPIRRLDDLEPELPVPDAIKIDVEGAAPAVVRGAAEILERHEPTVFVELHRDGLADDILVETRAALETVGYRIRERDEYWRCESCGR